MLFRVFRILHSYPMWNMENRHSEYPNGNNLEQVPELFPCCNLLGIQHEGPLCKSPISDFYSLLWDCTEVHEGPCSSATNSDTKHLLSVWSFMRKKSAILVTEEQTSTSFFRNLNLVVEAKVLTVKSQKYLWVYSSIPQTCNLGNLGHKIYISKSYQLKIFLGGAKHSSK